jgi:hypothetical protein
MELYLANNWLNINESNVQDGRLCLAKGGFVGINNTNPAFALDVVGTANSNQYVTSTTLTGTQIVQMDTTGLTVNSGALTVSGSSNQAVFLP